MSLVTVDHLFAHQATFLTRFEKEKFLAVLKSGEGKTFQVDDFRHLTGRSLLRCQSWDPMKAWERALREMEAIDRSLYQGIVLEDDDYPPLLKEIFDSPFLLFAKGSRETLKKLPVGVVGTRLPTTKAKQAAWEIGYQLGTAKVPIVSGLALGIDSFAHAGCHKSGIGSMAVLGSGLNSIYPVANRQLAKELLELGGLLLSEYQPDTPPAAFRFPHRNRIVAGLVRELIVVQAPEKSGALITAQYALDHGREVFVCAEGLNGERGFGTKNLANSGAFVIKNSKQILELFCCCDYNG